MFLKKQDARNGNGTTKGAQTCRTPGCHCTANADSGYCFACEAGLAQHKPEWMCKSRGCYHVANPESGYCDVCEIQYAKWVKEVSDWYTLDDWARSLVNGARR